MWDSANNPLSLARFELKRFRGPLPRLALGFILLIPLLYGCIYLAGNWDPYGRLDRVPVAVVNHDVPTTVNDSSVAAGKDFVDSLHRANTFDFIDTDATEAADGLSRGRYYLVITVPESFSTDLVSGQGTDPRRAQIMLQRNDANGFVIGTITNSAQNSIARAIDETAVRSYFEAVFANLATIRDGMTQAADGAAQLDTGLASAHEGSTQLRSGTATAASGADSLVTGATQVATGSATARDGSKQLASGLDQLSSGAGTLSSGATQVAGGTQQLADTLDPILGMAADKLPAIQDRVTRASATIADVSDKLAQGSTSISGHTASALADLEALIADHPELASNPRSQRLRDSLEHADSTATTVSTDLTAAAADAAAANKAIQGAGDLSAKATEAKAKIDQLNDGAHQVAGGAKQLDQGLDKAAPSAHTLADGLTQLASGSGQLRDGATQLASGTHQLADGAASLDDGLGQLATGAHELATKLAEGAARIPALTPDQTTNAVQVLSAPVDVTMQVENPAHVYGRGLAPMFFSIALWVLGISAFFLVRPITGRVIAGRAGDLRIAITAWLPLAGISVLASWLMLGAAWIGLGLDPVHPGLMIVMVTLVALAFSAVAHLLRTSLGLVATAAMLIVLILQLSSSGGTYPPELLPPFFAAIGHVMPMTYTIDAFRICISGGLMSKLARDAVLMLILLVSCVGLLVLVVHRRRQFTTKDLHPPLG